MRSYALLAALTITSASALSLADPPAPKVCVVVAGDPDAVARGSATRLATAISARSDLRGVSDADTRAVLRGESRPDPSLGPLATLRRALSGTDADAVQLEAIGQRLGCGLTVEIAARPAGLSMRNFDVVHRVFEPSRTVTAIDSSAVDRWIAPAARAALSPDAPTIATNESPAITPAIEPPAPTTTAATPLPATAPTIASGVVSPTATPPPTNASVVAATPTTTGPTATPRAETPALPAATVVAPANTVAVTGPVSGTTTAPTTAAARDRAPPAHPDPRVSLNSGEIPTDTGGPGIAGWIVAGGAAVALIAVFVIVQAAAGPGTPPISVMHTGASP